MALLEVSASTVPAGNKCALLCYAVLQLADSFAVNALTSTTHIAAVQTRLYSLSSLYVSVKETLAAFWAQHVHLALTVHQHELARRE